MKVKALVNKVADFGTHPYIYIKRCSNIIGEGKPDDISKNFGELTVNTFIATNCGKIMVFVK